MGDSQTNMLRHASDPEVLAKQVAGLYEASWNGRDQSGRPAGSGLFLLRLSCAGVVAHH